MSRVVTVAASTQATLRPGIGTITAAGAGARVAACCRCQSGVTAASFTSLARSTVGVTPTGGAAAAGDAAGLLLKRSGANRASVLGDLSTHAVGAAFAVYSLSEALVSLDWSTDCRFQRPWSMQVSTR